MTIHTKFEEYQKRTICEYLDRKARLYQIGVENNSMDLRMATRSQINLILELAVDLKLYSQEEVNEFRRTLQSLYNY